MTRSQLCVAFVVSCLAACSNQPTSLPVPPHLPFEPVEAPFDETTVRTIYAAIADDCPPADDLHYFLPKKFLSWVGGNEAQALTVANKTFAGLREPSLFCGADPDEAYRLVGFPSFSDPWSIRVFRQGGSYRLVAVKSGFEYGPVERFWDIERFSKDLSRSDWEALTAQIERDAYWSVGSVDDRFSYFDGVGWMFEGRRGGRYHPVRRVATSKGPLVGTAIMLRRLSGLTLESQRFGLGGGMPETAGR